MPIQRTVSLPAPSDAVARARRELAPRYGAQIWDGPDRRVLLVRVPRREPDPVNDVEEAVEFLASADVKEITHCLLVGDEAVAQVYARPLQDLMREREGFDRRTAASWRERLPGHLSHTVFQAPDDPRRRWRLVVRLPLESVRELDEEVLEDLADGMGAELETQRFSQIAAVYLVASTDDVRLEADMFLQELRSKWQSEEGRRRKALQAAQRDAEEQRRREQERRQVLREMEARIKQERRQTVPARVEERGRSDLSAGQRVEQARQAWDERVGKLDATPRRLHKERRASDGHSASQPGPRMPPGTRVASPDEEPLAESLTSIRPRAGGPVPGSDGPAPDADGPDDPPRALPRIKPLQVPHRVRELRARVDQAITGKPSRRAPDGADSSQAAVPRGPAEPVGARVPEEPPESAGGSASRASEHTEAVGAPREPENRQETAAVPPALRALHGRLEEAGFEILVSPPTAGHVIDLAAERPGGDVQRIVVRAVDRLDPDVAKELLKTARELEVDLVLCVADAIQHEALRLLVATKVSVVRPEETDKFEF